MMRYLRAFVSFWWDFLVGDDPRLAIGALVTVIATAGLSAAGWPAWWLPPVAVVLVLFWSVRRSTLDKRD